MHVKLEVAFIEARKEIYDKTLFVQYFAGKFFLFCTKTSMYNINT